MHSPELLKGTLQTIVLKVLKDHGKMYYNLTTEGKSLVNERVNEFIRFIQTMENVLQVDFK
jgi:predicted transcriptional regulator